MAAMDAVRALPPGPPPGMPLFGQGLRFARDPLGFLERAAREYGDISYFRLGPHRVYYVTRPELVWEVMVTQRASFEISGIRTRLEAVLGTGLLTSRGELHARQRRLLLPMFRRTRIEAHAGAMTAAALQARDRWRDGETIDATAEMMTLAMLIAAKTLFSHDIRNETDAVSRNIGLLMSHFKQLMSPFLRFTLRLPLPSSRRFWRAARELDALIYGMIEHRRRNPGGADDLLALLIQARDDQTNVFMTDRQVRDELITLFVAGHETTANALAWTLYLLALHPDADAKLQAELRGVLAGRHHFEPADLDRLPFARQTIAEGLRLYPPGWFTGRSALADTELAGYPIPRGATVLMSQYVMQRDARYYREPGRFLPERWTPEFVKSLPRGAYFPFGGGDRHCIGESFAWQEAILLLATLAERWRFEPEPGQDIRPDPSITLRPNRGIRLVVRERPR